MYLRGLHGDLRGVFDSSFTATPLQTSAANATNTMALQTSMQYNSCIAAHGYWDGHTCTLPNTSAPASAPAVVTVTVPTNVSTQVSPQISPNLIQQQQPTNSPVGASTSSSPAQTASSPQQPQDSGLEAALAQMAQDQAARDKALQDQIAAQAAAQAAQPQMVMQPNTPAPVDTTTATAQTVPQAAPDYTKYILIGVAALLGVTLIVSHKQQKRKG